MSTPASRAGPPPPPPDTIVAAATPPGYGGIAIVRLSGAAVPAIAAAMLGALPEPRLATGARFLGRDAHTIDAGLALYFPAPHSYTGEHVLELQGHGGPVLVGALIRRALELGARRAQPGEFTQRAYLNGKLDLAQAEAVADLINAASEAGARAALRSLDGEFSVQVRALGESLRQLRTQVEAALDFAEEPIDVLADAALGARLHNAAKSLATLRRLGTAGRALTEGITIVIAGPPNAGKSSLLNRLVEAEAAIVTDIAGTTRDLLRERVVIDGVPVHILDTAGLREHSSDAIEMEGIRRAQRAMAQADRILFVLDSAADPQGLAYAAERARLPIGVPVTRVFNKIDLLAAGVSAEAALTTAANDAAGATVATVADGPATDVLRVSARSGQGIERLRAHLRACAGAGPGAEEGGAFAARARHLEALELAQNHLAQAILRQQQREASELVAEELRRAQLALEQIIGSESSDELLGRIFAAFCVGK